MAGCIPMTGRGLVHAMCMNCSARVDMTGGRVQVGFLRRIFVGLCPFIKKNLLWVYM